MNNGLTSEPNPGSTDKMVQYFTWSDDSNWTGVELAPLTLVHVLCSKSKGVSTAHNVLKHDTVSDHFKSYLND
jgi:hypothetical protein